MSSVQEVHNKCSEHPQQQLEFFCSLCNNLACTDCEHYISCLKHDVIPIKIAIDNVNREATEIIKIAKDIKQKLEDTFYSIFDDKSDFESHLKLCRTAIEFQTKTIIEKVQKKRNKLMLDLENICKQKNESIENQVKELESKQIKLQSLMASVTKMMNKPEEKETLASKKSIMNDLRKKVLEINFDKRKIIPNFTPCTHLDEVINMKGIGKITSVDNTYIIDKDDKSITVTNGQPFVVKVSRIGESDTCQLAATLTNSSGEESAAEVEDLGSGEYRITSSCNEEGDWHMEITAGVAHIKGSPVNVKVEKLGLVHTTGNISDYKEHDKMNQVVDVILDADGCILVSSDSKDLLKFNQSGSFVAIRQVPQNVKVGRMHQMDNGHMVYNDYLGKLVLMCDDKLKEIRSFGKGLLKWPNGLAVNKESRILYIADGSNHCVFKFNVDDGKLLGMFGSKGQRKGQMNQPSDVTLTKEGHVIVADYGNDRIQMFNANDKFMRILVDVGIEEGKVWKPRSVTMDMDGNLLVSGNHNLQLFDINGVFIKRIDKKYDGVDMPFGISVISYKPRRVAVANYKQNNVKILNY